MQRNDLERVLDKLDSVEEKIADLTLMVFEKVGDIEKKHAELNVKAGVWGLLGGLISILIMISIQVFFKK